MSDVDVLRKIEIELRDKIARLESELSRLRAELETAKKCIRSMWKNDKTPTYEYYGKNRRTRFGDCPSVGERWKTPREIAESVIGESALYAMKEKA